MGQFGRDLRRVEDDVLLRGKGTYTDDLKFPDALYAYIVRSPVASATINSLDISAAKSADGVVEVLTGKDAEADGLGRLIAQMGTVNDADGNPIEDASMPILALDEVRFIGQPVAAVIAGTLAQAKDAAELVEVDYDIRPAVTNSREATADGAPQLCEGIEHNVAETFEGGDAKAVEEAFAKATHVTKLKLVNNRVVVNSMEPRAVIADYIADSGRSFIHTQTQGGHFVLNDVADNIFKIDKKLVRILTPSVGGGFGMKNVCYPEQAVAIWASRRLKKPVRWTSDRSEAFLSDAQGRDQISETELALDKDGRFLALRSKIYGNLGGYSFAVGGYIAHGTVPMLSGCYKIPAIYAKVYNVLTNTVPTSAYRGAGRPEAAYIVERIVDQAAREMGLDPADIRRRNFIQPEDMPYQTPVGPTYDVGDFPAVLEAGLKKADRDGFETRRQQSEANGKLRGIGIGYYIEQSGGGFFETVNLKFPGDGTVVAYMGTQDNGQGHQIAYKQVLADQFEIDLDQVVIKQGDTDTSGFGMTGGSRSLPVGGGVLVGVAGKVKDKGKQIAARLLEAAVADIEFSGGAFNIAGTDRSVGLFDVAEAARDPKNLPEGMEPGLDDSDIFADAGMTFPNGCHVAEIEIDPETGDVSVVKYTAVDDFGNIVNPLLVDGQNHGGITQGIGQALFEHTVYGEDGQLQTGSFMDYTMPRADGVPSFSLSFLNTPATGNPLGLKGVAEAGTIAAPPAVMNAIVDALHRRKEQVQIDMPATPLAVWQALNA